jgi:hypothetical protein
MLIIKKKKRKIYFIRTNEWTQLRKAIVGIANNPDVHYIDGSYSILL